MIHVVNRAFLLQRDKEKCNLVETTYSVLTETTAIQCSSNVMRRVTPTRVNLPDETCIFECNVSSQIEPTCSIKIAVVITVSTEKNTTYNKIKRSGLKDF